MKFATYEYRGEVRVGLVQELENRILPVPVPDMLSLISCYDDLKSSIGNNFDPIPLDGVRLLAPIPRPRNNIICVGKNYRAHAKEFAQSGYEANAKKGAEIDEYPAVFTKRPQSVIGPGVTIELHPGVTSEVDYEVELTIVIGKSGRNILRADALKHIWGYTIINDVTARDRQKNHKQWYLGKSLDTFCPMGPWIVTADEIDPENVQVKTWVNDELRQDANTRDLIFDIPGLIETISAGATLEAGDLIATGTPEGVGIGFRPPKFLKKGDVVTVAADGIGVLANPFG
ncbi:fumarylacetoacetate hydrolase family protein [Microvirga massiliensis]|uniref:fumarylacetoacetate hydrolase family protein n=1 Tax=Microvirga massiliensis TaxID=1033741 RepID=UPI00062B73B3|nr:fumarylacetoacetate hydrolase family protein [Microvirga massiliensis]